MVGVRGFEPPTPASRIQKLRFFLSVASSFGQCNCSQKPSTLQLIIIYPCPDSFHNEYFRRLTDVAVWHSSVCHLCAIEMIGIWVGVGENMPPLLIGMGSTLSHQRRILASEPNYLNGYECQSRESYIYIMKH